MDNIFNQACFSKNVWSLANAVMDKFEEGDLKNHMLTAKSLITKPEFRQQFFSPGQCLPDPFKVEALQEVFDGDLSLSELKEKATEYRSHRASEKAFCKITNTTWEKAKRRYPHHTKPERLAPFASIISKKLPVSFVAFCQSALRSEESQCEANNLDVYKVDGCSAYLLQGDIFEVCCRDIREVYPTYMGTNLFIGRIQKIRTRSC